MTLSLLCTRKQTQCSTLPKLCQSRLHDPSLLQRDLDRPPVQTDRHRPVRLILEQVSVLSPGDSNRCTIATDDYYALRYLNLGSGFRPVLVPLWLGQRLAS